MLNLQIAGTRLYRLVVAACGADLPKIIEFTADGAESALTSAERNGDGREVALFEDGLPIARVRHVARDGFWIINEPTI